MKLRIQLSTDISKQGILNIRKIISSNEGILACEINSKGTINIVFDDITVNKNDIISLIEDSGYVVLKVL